MKIVVFSDIHGQQSKKLTQWFNNNPADLLLFAGDLQANQTGDYGIQFIEWFHELPYKDKIMVFGNHDGHYMSVINHVINKKYNDIRILIDGAIKIKGIKIFGSPHSVEFGSWWFMKKDDELEELWKKIPDDTDILITHGPPFGILDITINNSTTGSKTLLKRVNELKNLRYHIFGHIHESYGRININGKTFINASLLNEKYQMVNEPMIINYIIEKNYNVGE
jgi:Icc-related predicted phosphoesterase